MRKLEEEVGLDAAVKGSGAKVVFDDEAQTQTRGKRRSGGDGILQHMGQ